MRNNFPVEAKGAFEECDRRILAFNNIYSIPFPYRIIKDYTISLNLIIFHIKIIWVLLWH